MKLKTCKACKGKFTPERQMQTTCNFECAIEYTEILKAKKNKKAKTASRVALNKFNNSDIAKLKRKAQTVFNEFIRLRDVDKLCISCNHSFKGDKPRQRHAGHFRPQGGNSLLRFNEKNCHAQCSICNNHKSGNLVPYRENIVKLYGLKVIEELESMNTIKKWNKEELLEIIKKYRLKIKDLKGRV